MTAAGRLMECLPEVTLEDAVLKIRDLKAELAHVREVQQQKIEKLTRQLAMLETFHLEDRRKMMDAMRQREALLINDTDPAKVVRVDTVDAMRRDHTAEVNALNLAHTRALRDLEEQLEENRTALAKAEAASTHHRELAELHTTDATALRKALEGQHRLGEEERGLDLQSSEMWAEFVCEIRAAYGVQAVDAVILRTLKNSQQVKQLNVDVLGLIGERLDGFDMRRAEASFYHHPGGDTAPASPVTRGGVASPGGGPSRGARVASPPRAAPQRRGGDWLMHADDLHRAAADLRRSRSHESARWSRSPHLHLQAPPMSPVSPRSAASRSPVRRAGRPGSRSPPRVSCVAQPWQANAAKSPPFRQPRGQPQRLLVSNKGRTASPWAEDWAEYWAGWGSRPQGERGGTNAPTKTPLNLHPQRTRAGAPRLRSTSAQRRGAPTRQSRSTAAKARSLSAPQRPYAQAWMPPPERERLTGRDTSAGRRPASPAARAILSRNTPTRPPWPL